MATRPPGAEAANGAVSQQELLGFLLASSVARKATLRIVAEFHPSRSREPLITATVPEANDLSVMEGSESEILAVSGDILFPGIRHDIKY